jgi:regulator of sigma E protease
LDSLTLLAAFDLTALLNILTVALGLGLVIFFHELGHFAVAKWCDVNVERFSIGFGPVLLSRKWGETEYALSAIPFGGYVKMLGQDDADPSQQTSEEVAQDPRSYTAKTVPQRMAIISAGVTMNIITGLMFFVIAFVWGVERPDNQVGFVQIGSPAWEAGIRPGDTLLEFNGNRVDDFMDVVRNVALSDGPVTIKGQRPEGAKYTVTVNPTKPEGERTRRQIGVLPAFSLEVGSYEEFKDRPAVVPDSPAAAASPAFEPGDHIRRVGDVPVETFAQMEAQFAAHRNEPVDVYLQRGEKQDELIKVTVPVQPYRTLGLQMDIGKVNAVRPGSPGEAARILPGDKITQVEGRKVGDEIDPMRLDDVFAERIGQATAIRISREVAGSEPATIELTVTPEATPGWVERPDVSNSPISITSIGVAYELIPTVFRIEPGGPADKAGLKERDQITKMELVLQDGLPEEVWPRKSVTIDIGTHNWGYAFWQLQQQPVEKVLLTIKGSDGAEREPIEITPVVATDWNVAGERGLLPTPHMVLLKAQSAGEAVDLGWRHTVNSTKDIYLTLRGLLTGNISPRELHGPINIAKAAYQQAGRGLSEFILFLALISINLAVINFLPIPVLDGGHMVFLMWEAVIRRRPNEKVVSTATYCGLFFVLGLMMFVIYLDLFGH